MKKDVFPTGELVPESGSSEMDCGGPPSML